MFRIQPSKMIDIIKNNNPKQSFDNTEITLFIRILNGKKKEKNIANTEH